MLIRKLTIVGYDKICIYEVSSSNLVAENCFFSSVMECFCGDDMLDLRRNFGLETKSLLICMTRDLVILVILISSLQGPTIVVMVNNILPQLENTLLNSSGTFLNRLS